MPLWVPHKIHHKKDKVACKSQKQKILREASLESLGDIVNDQGGIITWDRLVSQLPKASRQAYNVLCDNINMDGARVATNPRIAALFYPMLRELKVTLCGR